MLARFWNTLTDPLIWSRLWEDFVTVVTHGTPPIYVQYLIATVIFLAYVLFFHDRKKDRIRGLKRWIIFVPGLIYGLSLVVITAGGMNFMGKMLNPQTYKQPLVTIRESVRSVHLGKPYD